jgi:hypothetical protein
MGMNFQSITWAYTVYVTNTEVELFKKRDNCGAFLFRKLCDKVETASKVLKKIPIIQVSRRLQEYDLSGSVPGVQTQDPDCDHLCISCTLANNCCILVDNDCCCLVINKSNMQVTCMVFTEMDVVYTHLIDSRRIGICEVCEVCSSDSGTGRFG